jgi:hypothetical protein
VDRSGDKTQSDERRGDPSHAAYDGSGAVLVATSGRTERSPGHPE